MQITKEWLNQAILIDEKLGNYAISQKQTDLLHKWFPDLFYREENKSPKSFVKHWPELLCNKSINDIQAKQFINAKMKQYESPHVVSETLKIIIDRGLEACRKKYGKDPERPQLRLISLIGHMEGVHVQEVFFSPEPNAETKIRFYFQAKITDEPVNYWVICSSSKLTKIDGKICPETILYKEQPRTIIDNNIPIYGDKVKDCTGLEITDCINEFRPIKKIVVVRKVKVPKPIKKAPIVKAMEKSINKFNEDFATINKKRSQKGLDPISIETFAATFNIDSGNTLSVLTYVPSQEILKSLLN